MEDAATAEISRSQIWQWVDHGAELATGQPVTAEMARAAIATEMASLRRQLGEASFDERRFDEARSVFERVALSPAFVEFLTLPAYDLL
jgi:malate synthase